MMESREHVVRDRRPSQQGPALGSDRRPSKQGSAPGLDRKHSEHVPALGLGRKHSEHGPALGLGRKHSEHLPALGLDRIPSKQGSALGSDRRLSKQDSALGLDRRPSKQGQVLGLDRRPSKQGSALGLDRRPSKQGQVLGLDRRPSMQGSEFAFDRENRSKQQEMQTLRKQQERLENEKLHNMQHSFLTKDKRFTISKGEHPNVNLDQQSSSTHEPDNSVKSRHVELEKCAPGCGRRQSMKNPAPSPPPAGGSISEASQAMETSNATYAEIIRNLRWMPSRIKKNIRPEVNDESDVNKTDLQRETACRHDLCKGWDALKNRFIQRRAITLPANSHVHDVPTDADDNTRSRIQALYSNAIESVASCMTDKSGHHRLKKFWYEEVGNASTGFALVSHTELESILRDAKAHANRNGPNGTTRAQKKRIELLEHVLNKLHPKSTTAEFDPTKVLQCSYLRLSISNVETLESMIREQGKDPGIHIHSDVRDYDVFKGLKEERTDLQQPEMKQEKGPTPKLGISSGKRVLHI